MRRKCLQWLINLISLLFSTANITTYTDETSFRVSSAKSWLRVNPGLKLLHRLDAGEFGDRAAAGRFVIVLLARRW